jgi:CRISPR-associated protein Cas1
MRHRDFHVLPKFRDGWSYLYVEHCRIDQEAKAIAIIDENGRTPIPCATLRLLMLGPGTRITHAAVGSLADNGCLVCWCGEEGVRLYAHGHGGTRNSHNLLRQAQLWASEDLRLSVVRKMYERRFNEPLDESLSLRQIRGKEGIRVREAYSNASRITGVSWTGRSYDRKDWLNSDPVNRALSSANSCLYGICHAGILALGLSPALGFIHTGKMLSFVYDIADLYKTDISIPTAFKAASEGGDGLERRVRKAIRDHIREHRLLRRIVEDIRSILDLKKRGSPKSSEIDFESDPALPGALWDPIFPDVKGGVDHSNTQGTGQEDGSRDT